MRDPAGGPDNGQVYTTLQRLERDGFVESDGAGGAKTQNACTITPSGASELTTWLLTPSDVVPPPRDELVMKVLVAMRRVSKVYGSGPAEVHALREVDLTVGSGELVAVMGPSGSGKSTPLTIAGTLEDPTSGDVLVGGRHLAATATSCRVASASGSPSRGPSSVSGACCWPTSPPAHSTH
jgi:ABC-type glutathione transport system ATPase component